MVEKIKENINKNKSYLIIIVIIILIIAVFITKQVLSNESNNSNVITNKTYKVYNFGSELCPACKQMDPIYEKIKEEYKHLLDFEYIDVNENIKLSYTYEIEYTPTFIIVDETGAKVDKLIGYVPEKEFRKFVDKWSNK